MKLLLDMQGTQCQSRHRGIGRYSLGLAKAFAALAADRHDVRFAFNAQLDEAADAVITALAPHADGRQRLWIKSLGHVCAQQAGNETRRRAAERVVRHAVEQSGTDLVWYSSMIEGYADDAVIPETPVHGALSVATLYDLIPLHDPDAYLNHPRVRTWYEDKVRALSQCDLLLSISEWVRRDAMDRLGLSGERIVNIGAGVDERFRRPANIPALLPDVQHRHGIVKPYVLYNGGFDERKNVARLIQAFADLPADIRARHQLVIVGRVSDEQMALLSAAIRRSGLAQGSIVFTGFVSDDALIGLYACCALFVFPSMLEGFGLPPLEAMACGAPVIASNTTSLPEVMGEARATFDPTRSGAITEKMRNVLGHAAFADELRAHGQRQSQKFTWRAVAERALLAIEQLPTRRVAKPARNNKNTLPSLLCLCGSNPPAWLGQLHRHYQLEITQIPADDAPPVRERLRDAQRMLYVVGEDEISRIASWMPAWPGAVVLGAATGPVSPLVNQKNLIAIRYRVQGFGGLGKLGRDAPSRWQTAAPVLRDNCLGIFVNHAEAPLAQGMGDGMPIAVLPQSEQASFCAAQLEEWHRTSPLARELDLLRELSITVAPSLDEDDLARVSDAIASARPPSGPSRWLVDVTQIARNDIGTGIQRVVRSILRHWLQTPPAGVRIEPIAFADGRYRYARRYALGLLDLPPDALTDEIVDARPGDTYVGLDWIAETLPASEPQLREWHRLGISFHFVINDLLPVSMPEAFHPYARDLFSGWLRRVCALADHLHCISRATAAELATWLRHADLPYQFGRMPSIDSFPLGVELTRRDTTPSALPPELAQAATARPTLLMVGTLEPRKGHTQALDAIEQLWAQGQDLNLVIVGHYGWLVESLVRRLENHQQRGHRLFWLDQADDGMLASIYAVTTALLAPSFGEGYGLPLVEAAHRRLPVIARDLPVFREVMDEYPSYFTASAPSELADAIAEWLAHRPLPGQPRHWPSWQESAAALAHAVQAYGHGMADEGVQTIV
ncbi:glycosyltransferase family 1 protein [Dyella sp. RRB7]|uniref:glycosyltransferase family 4 protein n=1 Tax=Dyella sp. RRB7 TaxID=2919502 RepID=UPI001FA9B92B|nr:glycosyltransferase family 1 protein [Dyella sp. RRB7]